MSSATKLRYCSWSLLPVAGVEGAGLSQDQVNLLRGMAFIGGFFFVAFGSMMACGVTGGIVASVVPAVRRRATPTLRWLVAAGIAGYAGGVAGVVVWAALRSTVPALDGTGVAPLVAWAAALVFGAVSRLIGLGHPRRVASPAGEVSAGWGGPPATPGADR